MTAKKATTEKKKTTEKTPAKKTIKKEIVTEEAIRTKAEAIYQERVASGEAGDHLSDWLKAESELKKGQ